MNLKLVFAICFAFLSSFYFSGRSYAFAFYGEEDSSRTSKKTIDSSQVTTAACGGYISFNYSNETTGAANVITQIKVISPTQTQPLIFNSPTSFPFGSMAPTGINATIEIVFSPQSTNKGIASVYDLNTGNVLSSTCYHAPEEIIIQTDILCEPHLEVDIIDGSNLCDE